MEYTLSRFKKILNEDNTIKEIFIAVKINDGVDVWEQGYWLTDVERNLVIIDEKNLTVIIDKIAIKGQNALIAYRLEPPIEYKSMLELKCEHK